MRGSPHAAVALREAAFREKSSYGCFGGNGWGVRRAGRMHARMPDGDGGHTGYDVYRMCESRDGLTFSLGIKNWSFCARSKNVHQPWPLAP